MESDKPKDPIEGSCYFNTDTQKIMTFHNGEWLWLNDGRLKIFDEVEMKEDYKPIPEEQYLEIMAISEIITARGCVQELYEIDDIPSDEVEEMSKKLQSWKNKLIQKQVLYGE